MIEINDLSKKFVRTLKKGKKEEFYAVDHVSFSLEKGEILGLLGPNGAGKTTLLRMIASLMDVTEGEVVMYDHLGKQFKDKESIKQNIGYLSENTKLYHRFSPKEMLQLFGELYGYKKEKVRDRIEEIANLLQMDSFLDNRIEKLSTGQKQRTSIARCLIHDPDFYIFDEPTLGLDVISSKAIIDFMKKEKENGKSVIYSTHYMEEAEFLCDRIIMLDAGKIIAEGAPQELKEKSATSNLRDAFFTFVEGGAKDEL